MQPSNPISVFLPAVLPREFYDNSNCCKDLAPASRKPPYAGTVPRRWCILLPALTLTLYFKQKMLPTDTYLQALIGVMKKSYQVYASRTFWN